MPPAMAAKPATDGDTVRRVAAPTAILLPALQQWRIRRSLTQTELGELAGVTRSTITRLETGKPALVKTAGALARALNCTVDDLRRVD